MFRTARLQTVVMLAIGGIGGWLVGSGRIQSLSYAQTSSPPRSSASLRQSCCDHADRGVLLAHPFEKGPISSIYHDDWQAHRMFTLVPAQAFVAKWISSFKDFPPRQKPSSFSIEDAMKKLEEGPRGN